MKQLLMDNWKFMLNSNGSPWAWDFDDSGWRGLNLPHDWQIEGRRDPKNADGHSQGFFPRGGTGWYRLKFTVKAAGEKFWLYFDGVQRFSTVWLNGQALGSRPYGYVPFFYEIQDLLNQEGENLLVVKVDNSSCSADRWYSGAGIFRQVSLIGTPLCHVAPFGVTVTTPVIDEEKALVRGQIEVINPGAGAITVSIAGIEESRQVLPVAQNVTYEYAVQSPRLWSPETPALYSLVVDLMGEETKVDFGIREAYFDGDKGFFLNGDNLKLKGVNLHHDGGAVGAAVPVVIWERRMKKLKAIGCNAIRCSHNPQATEFYELADKIGFLVIDEIYDKWAPSGLYYNELYEAWWEKDLAAMIGRDKNHPSIILWSVGNELENQYQELFYENAEKMCKKARELDPTRPVSLALMPYCTKAFGDNCPMEENLIKTLRYAQIVDVLMLNYMESNYLDLKKAGLTKSIIGSEIYTYYRSVEGQFTQIYPCSPYNDVVNNDFVAGGFLWAGIDYLGEAVTGWPCRGWTGCLLDSAAFQKTRTKYYECQWKEEPVLSLALFDESEQWDMANNDWGFPQMLRHWNYSHREKVMHVAAITNCDEVLLYLNGEPVRKAKTNGDDHMAHFYIPYRPGTLRAIGLRNGEALSEDCIKTSGGMARMVFAAEKMQFGSNVVPVELWLKDEFGQTWVQDTPMVQFSLEGGEIFAIDNGDFLSAEEFTGTRKSFFQGHILILLKRNEAGGRMKLTASAEGLIETSVIL